MIKATSRLLGQQIAAIAFPLPTAAEVIGAGIAIVLLALVVWIVRSLLRKSVLAREMEHVERLRSIEAGLPWHSNPGACGEEAAKSQRLQMDNAFWIALWLVVVGVAGPFHAVSALLGTESGSNAKLAVAALIAAGAASGIASICAVVVILCSRPSIEDRNDAGSATVRHV